jgi:predicted nuclease with TOPRIM domain
LTNTLQKKLNEVRREKALLEQQIEREQLSHSELVSRLQNMAIGNSAASSVHVTDAAAEGAAVIRE